MIPVQCREDSGALDVDVPYGLAVSMEVKEEVGIPLHEEIQVSVREAVRTGRVGFVESGNAPQGSPKHLPLPHLTML